MGSLPHWAPTVTAVIHAELQMSPKGQPWRTSDSQTQVLPTYTPHADAYIPPPRNQNRSPHCRIEVQLRNLGKRSGKEKGLNF